MHVYIQIISSCMQSFKVYTKSLPIGYLTARKIITDKRLKKIQKYWDAVIPEMMTEEEMGEEGNYIHLTLSWLENNEF